MVSLLFLYVTLLLGTYVQVALKKEERKVESHVKNRQCSVWLLLN